MELLALPSPSSLLSGASRPCRSLFATPYIFSSTSHFSFPVYCGVITVLAMALLSFDELLKSELTSRGTEREMRSVFGRRLFFLSPAVHGAKSLRSSTRTPVTRPSRVRRLRAGQRKTIRTSTGRGELFFPWFKRLNYGDRMQLYSQMCCERKELSNVRSFPAFSFC